MSKLVTLNQSVSIANEVINKVKDKKYAKSNIIADVESSPTIKSYAVGDYLIYNENFYNVVSAIATGDELVVGQNIIQTFLADKLQTNNGNSSFTNNNNEKLNTVSTGMTKETSNIYATMARVGNASKASQYTSLGGDVTETSVNNFYLGQVYPIDLRQVPNDSSHYCYVYDSYSSTNDVVKSRILLIDTETEEITNQNIYLENQSSDYGDKQKNYTQLDEEQNYLYHFYPSASLNDSISSNRYGYLRFKYTRRSTTDLSTTNLILDYYVDFKTVFGSTLSYDVYSVSGSIQSFSIFGNNAYITMSLSVATKNNNNYYNSYGLILLCFPINQSNKNLGNPTVLSKMSFYSEISSGSNKGVKFRNFANIIGSDNCLYIYMTAFYSAYNGSYTKLGNASYFAYKISSSNEVTSLSWNPSNTMVFPVTSSLNDFNNAIALDQVTGGLTIEQYLSEVPVSSITYYGYVIIDHELYIGSIYYHNVKGFVLIFKKAIFNNGVLSYNTTSTDKEVYMIEDFDRSYQVFMNNKILTPLAAASVTSTGSYSNYGNMQKGFTTNFIIEDFETSSSTKKIKLL